MSTVAKNFEISNWKPYVKNTLQGFFTLRLPSGVLLHGLTYHTQNGARWVGLPAKEYKKDDGTKSWVPVVEIPDQSTREAFQRNALAAIDDFLKDQI